MNEKKITNDNRVLYLHLITCFSLIFCNLGAIFFIQHCSDNEVIALLKNRTDTSSHTVLTFFYLSDSTHTHEYVMDVTLSDVEKSYYVSGLHYLLYHECISDGLSLKPTHYYNDSFIVAYAVCSLLFLFISMIVYHL